MSSDTIGYGTERHDRIRNALQARIDASMKIMSRRFHDWNDAEELYQAYIPTSDRDALRDEKRRAGTPEYTTINVPYSYAMLLTAHTYWSSIFLSRNPVHQVNARHGNAEMSVPAMEALLDYQLTAGEMLVPYYGWLLDTGKFGIGIVGNYWDERKKTVYRWEEGAKLFAGVPIPGTVQRTRVKAIVEGYHGNKIFNVRPYDWLPDPSVSMQNFQQGEFCGRITTVSWNTILRGKAAGDYFNIDELKKVVDSGGQYRREPGSRATEMPEWKRAYSDMREGMKENVELVEMCIELVPSEEPWNLEDGREPEKWMFTFAENEVLIGAQPLGASHDRFPYSIMMYEIEPYAHAGRGMLQVLKPLNDAFGWLVNQHFYNVRQALNNQFVYDPSRISTKDLKDGGPGIMARLTPKAYGTDPKTAFAQIPFFDATRGHMDDATGLAEFMQRVVGVNETLMGMLDPGGRKTATEVRSSTAAGANRQKTFAEYNSALGMSPLVTMMISNTQDHYDVAQRFRIAGTLVAGKQDIVVDPEAIAGEFDYVPVDGTLPIDRFAQSQLWAEIFKELLQIPPLAQQYDLAGIFGWFAQLAGLKNINSFRLQVSPDQAMMAQVAAGQQQPLNGGLRP